MEKIEIIVKYNGDIMEVAREVDVVTEIISSSYAIMLVAPEQIESIKNYSQVEYIEYSSKLTLIDSATMISSCISSVNSDPGFNLRGSGVIVAVLDSGIDFRHPDFINEDGTSRILSLWDQDIPGGNPPKGFSLGTEYSQMQINEALNDNSQEVQHTDFNGHGTAVAGIAAGNGRASSGQYLGAAPESSLLIVKLAANSTSYFTSTTNLMRGVKYSLDRAILLNMPVVINISYGNSQGSHDGQSLFEQYLDSAADIWKNSIVVATGNEGVARHHFSGRVGTGAGLDAEFVVKRGLTSLVVTLCKSFTDIFSFEISNSSGEVSQVINLRSQTQAAYLSNAEIIISVTNPNPYYNEQNIVFLFRGLGGVALPQDIWSIRINGINVIDGRFNIWLPVLEISGSETRFLSPNSETTLTIPSTASKVISVGGYDSFSGNTSDFSGRGPSRLGEIKPDIVAPANSVTAPAPGGGYNSLTGTSFAAPHVSGACALMLEWGIVKNNDPFMYGQRLKAFLRLGAQRNVGIEYPNPLWGYGSLCVRESLTLSVQYTTTSNSLINALYYESLISPVVPTQLNEPLDGVSADSIPSVSPSVAVEPDSVPGVSPSVVVEPNSVPGVSPSVVVEPDSVPGVSASVEVEPNSVPSVSPSVAVEPDSVPGVSPSVAVEPDSVPGVSPSVAVEPDSVPGVSPSVVVEPDSVPGVSPSVTSEPDSVPGIASYVSIDPQQTFASGSNPVLDETYVDYSINYDVPSANIIEGFPDIFVSSVLQGNFAIAHLPLAKRDYYRELLGRQIFNEEAMICGLNEDTQALTASGITAVKNQSFLNLRGSGVIVGLVDTGIDFTNGCFMYESGNTKIVSLWDQSIEGSPPRGFAYGTQYTREQIDEANNSGSPYSLIPSRDEIGHGTFLASVMAARAYQFSPEGAAPDSEIIAVKLKTAKKIMRESSSIYNYEVPAYESTDIMAGVDYIFRKSVNLGRPCVILIALSTNSGAHDGLSFFGRYISNLSLTNGVGVVISVGNEGNQSRHFHAILNNSSVSTDIELNVASGDPGFRIDTWTSAPDRISISIITPLGGVVERRIFTVNESQNYNFVLEGTKINIRYIFPDIKNGNQNVIINFTAPTPGLWILRFYGDLILDGNINCWMPITPFCTEGTLFLNAEIERTVTLPSTALNIISVGAYDPASGGIYISTGRGPAASGRVCPDFVAPGVAVEGIYPMNRLGTLTGTSAAAAVAAGAAALILQWGIVQRNDRAMNTLKLKSYLLLGCEQRSSGISYPDALWGYGILNLINTFQRIK
ncbi:MAG: S8 family serine peptidase [Oscillospiraceae bacterium]|jgi:subtilisin family serine protease|nr:S8 family serine peptidase [Oscillospiraceae bacterium]